MAQKFVFHCLDILPRDETILSENDDSAEIIYDSQSESDEEYAHRQVAKRATAGIRSQLIIHMFGRTADGKAITIDVEGFCPYFFIAAPETLPPHQLRFAQKQLADYIERNGFYNKSVTISLEYKEKFYGFTNHTNFPFFRLTVRSMKEFQRLRRIFLGDQSVPQLKGPLGNLWPRGAPAVYEANIDPMLRFLHERDLAPCGWISCAHELPESGQLRCHYEDLAPAEAPMALAPFRLISWDIECFSVDGDFPKAKKDYWKPAKEICQVATSGRHAVELFEGCFPWDSPSGLVNSPPGINNSPSTATISPVYPKCKLTAELRAAFRKTMYNENTYATIERRIEAYKAATNAEGRDEAVNSLTQYLNKLVGARIPLNGDPAIQIGNVVAINGTVTERHLFAFPSCDPIEGAVVHVADTEANMLRQWFDWLAETNPDIMIGYNIFRFDAKYIWDRAEELGLCDEPAFQAFNRLAESGGELKLDELFLSSSALGDNQMFIWSAQGRLQIDLFYYIKQKSQLDKYSLDAVTEHFMSGDLVTLGQLEDTHATLKVKGAVSDCRAGRAIVLLDEDKEPITEKLIITEVLGGGELRVSVPPANRETWNEDTLHTAASWVIGKDDVGPKDLFRLHCGTAADRAIIGKYCIQDCDLVLDLYKKLEVFMNSMAMANVCSVPVRYIFTRGQGIKIESLIFKECSALNKCIVTLPAPNRSGTGESYEGAIVLTPVPGFYHRSPIGVGDFSSLYPSSIVSENISHDTLLWSKDYNEDGTYVRTVFGSEEYEGSEGVSYTDVKFDLWSPDPEDTRKVPEKIRRGFRVCRYAQDQPGTLPIIIKKLLAARNAKKKEMGRETDPMRKRLLDGEQLAYKLTANALYGQLGSGTFKIRLQDLAASTTAYGRAQLLFTKGIIERFYGPAAGDARCAANVMYGDTDSLFIEWNPRGPDGRPLEGREARQAAIELTQEVGHFVSQVLKPPHDFEFDKVYHPLLMFGKKKYAGKLYEFNADECITKYMGISLTRRDNAAILKVIYGKAMKQVLEKKDVVAAMDEVKRGAMELVEGKVKHALLIVTKSLRKDYADPTRIAHKVLADRMAARDPGTAPSVGDRMSFIYIKAPNAKLQGDRIEDPTFVKENKLEIDSQHYIQNQLTNPISQMFGLLLESMPGFKIDLLPHDFNEMGEEKQVKIRERVAAQMLFGDALKCIESSDMKRSLDKMFGGKVTITPGVKRTATQATTTLSVESAGRAAPKQSRLTNYFTNRQILETVGSSRRKTRSRESSVSTGSKGSTTSRK